MIYCSSCGKRAEAEMKYCPYCGQKLESNVFCLDDLSEPGDEKGPRAGIIAVQKHASNAEIPSGEQIYYSDEQGVCVTPSLLIIPGRTPNENPATYPLADITGVKSETDITARIIGAVGVVFGVALILARNQTSIGAATGIGTALIIIGSLMALFIRPTYHLKLSGPQGEIDALQMSQKAEFHLIIAAINRAMGKKV